MKTPSERHLPQTIAGPYTTLLRPLSRLLQEKAEGWARTLKVDDAEGLRAEIERFVDALKLDSDAFSEIRRRSSLVTDACGPGSRYASLRSAALRSVPRGCDRLSIGSITLEKLRGISAKPPETPKDSTSEETPKDSASEENPTFSASPRLIHVVVEVRNHIRELLCEDDLAKRSEVAMSDMRQRKESGTIDLSDADMSALRQRYETGGIQLSGASRSAFHQWYDECQRLKEELEPLSVDGCRFLYLLYESGSPAASDEARAVYHSIKSGFGGGCLPEILEAVNSIVDFAKLNPRNPEQDRPNAIGIDGKPLLTDFDPEARAYMDGNTWCTAAYASRRYGIKAPQLTKAATNPKGLRNQCVQRRQAQVEQGKGGARFVYHRGDLQLLSNALDPEE